MGSAVTRAQAVDATTVATLLDSLAIWQRDRGIDQWAPDTFADEVQAVIEVGDLYVMKRESTIVGCFMLESHCPEWLYYWLVEHGRRPADAMYLGRLAVTRELSGHGLGLELLDSARQIAAEAGFSFLRLNCPAENERLRRYYFDAGFEDLGKAELRGSSGERWVCSVLESPLPRTPTDIEGLELIFHVTSRQAWEAAIAAGEYRMSTRDMTLDDQGFIHCSDARQVERIANAIYGDVEEPLVVLEIDATKLGSEVRYENLDGGSELFPHVYGPLPIIAVVAVSLLERDATGKLAFPKEAP